MSKTMFGQDQINKGFRCEFDTDLLIKKVNENLISLTFFYLKVNDN